LSFSGFAIIRNKGSPLKQKAEKKPDNADRTESLGLYVLFGVVVIGAGVWHGEWLAQGLKQLESTVAGLDFWGPIIVTVLASFWAILCLPGPIMLGFIGTVYSRDPHIGLAVAVAADSVAEFVGFVVARHFGREQVLKRLGDKPWFQWLEEQIELRGAYGVFVIRMMPFFPNSLANYALGLSNLKFWPYFIASVLGSIPNLAVYIGGTAGVVHLVRHGLGGALNFYTAGGVILVTVVVLVALQAVLHRKLPEEDGQGD
jgi:uncharacterized membrane protein YdjX (TVP38/TMEM64 family)